MLEFTCNVIFQHFNSQPIVSTILTTTKYLFVKSVRSIDPYSASTTAVTTARARQ